MADNIYLRAGAKAGMPTLASREIAYVTDEEALYVGTASGNKKVCAASTEGRVTTLEGRATSLENATAGKLTATKATAQAELSLEAEAAAIASAFNSLIAAMKASGLMES